MAAPPPVTLALPDAPAVVAGIGRAAILTIDGEVLDLPPAEAARYLAEAPPPLLVHAPATWRRLGVVALPALDLLELFAFVLPARPVAPTPRGLALALDMDVPSGSTEDAALLLQDLAQALLARLSAGRDLAINKEAAGLAAHMGKAGRWGWAPYVLAALGKPNAAPMPETLRVWRRLPEWEDAAPLPPPASNPVLPEAARTRLAAMLGGGSEQRPGQADYAAAVTAAFAPRALPGEPHLVLAEAGTGTGKTLGYIAPASLWAEQNKGAVWISTFTRHLQRQVEAEMARLFPDPVERRRRVVVRKGRENYLCLLNLQDAVGASANLVPLGLVVRWALATSDGDIQGGDLPGWFGELFGNGLVPGLADRRGECLHGGCEHWRKCFVETGIRRARAAELVVANHALVMAQAVWGGLDDRQVPSRYVFDEGHHLFDAADSAFAAELSGGETAELRRWLLGAEGARSRARGLSARVEDLVAGQPHLVQALDATLRAARALPGYGWWERLGDAEPAANPTEILLHALRQQVLARATGEAEYGVVECDLAPVLIAVSRAAEGLRGAYVVLRDALVILQRGLAERLDAEPEDGAPELDEATRSRLEGAAASLKRRAVDVVGAWVAMLEHVGRPPAEPGTTPQHVMFLRLDRRPPSAGWGGRSGDRDVGLHRHWLDPTLPFAMSLAQPAHGMLITSATLRDAGIAEAEAAWEDAEARVGAPHLATPAIRVAVASPFDYAAQTRAFVITDVNGREISALAAAYRALFIASGGSALGLFTAISRLRHVHQRIAPALEAAGIPLFAQHVDAMDNNTLVDVFRTEEASCLLGTDAMRDGVDVPGRALRLVAFERVPWPRPDILHRERRVHLSHGDTAGYDDRIARFRLRQAFGRLIRSNADRGVFALLDRQAPSRLLSAFPAGVVVRRVGLAQAVAETREFLGTAD